jgi:hypothetical protein
MLRMVEHLVAAAIQGAAVMNRAIATLVFSALALDAHAALDLRANEQLSAEIATVSVPGSTKR